jgi:SAM-dependent methyltransferase
MACSVAAYRAPKGAGTRPRTELRLMIRPLPRSRICGSTARVIRIEPKRLVSNKSPSLLDRALLGRAGDAEARVVHQYVDFLLGASDAHPFDDGSFTALVCTTALHHFPDPQRSIDEMARVLAPGGRLVIGDACRDALTTKLADPLFRRFEEGHVGLQRRRDIEAMLTRAGLHVTNSRHVWLLIYALVRR